MSRIARGTAPFRRINLSLFAAGFATFSLLYCIQPLLPAFSARFGLSPAASSLALSVTTGVLAFAMLGAGALSDAIGRKPIMVASLTASAALGLACAFAPNYPVLLGLRALMGLSLSGLPAIAMAYVVEEMQPEATGLAMGLYIGGSAIGGMTGRLLAGVLADAMSWQAALGAIGIIGLVCAALLWRFLPESAHFQARPKHAAAILEGLGLHLREPLLMWLFTEAFVLMGGFVSVYNYLGYRLSAPPYRLSQTHIGLIFVVYLLGVASSAVMGHEAERLGRRPMIVAGIVLMLAGLALTLAAPLAAIVAGIACLTVGFFGAHSVASTWVSAHARTARAQAASLYLFAYYTGSSLVGTFGGVAWRHAGWPGLAGLVALLLSFGLFGSQKLNQSKKTGGEAPPQTPSIL